MKFKLLAKVSLLCISLLLALLCLSGCFSISEPMLALAISPNSGHPPFDITIAAACSLGGGLYTLVVDENSVAQSENGAFVTTIATWPWRGKVVWTNEDGVLLEKAIAIALENEAPIPHGLWTQPNTYFDNSLILVDLRHLPHGCLNGAVLTYTGFEDPENDRLKYRVEVEDMATGVFESVFYGPDRTLMGRTGFVDDPIFYWFVNYVGGDAFYQYFVWSPLECELIPNPTPTPILEGATVEKRIHIYVQEEWGTVTHWAYPILTAAPGC